MCGVLGAYGGDLFNAAQMLRFLKHRGPDGEAVVFSKNAYLGHTRLAIVDVVGGQQPISDSDGFRWLVCNGEIYNHAELRRQFPGYPYKTASDSEDILAVYERYQTETPTQLEGMFAFALLDGSNLFLARDPLGIKPLYFGWVKDTLFFASEIKALQDHVEQVYEFPPGYCYSRRAGFIQYYNLFKLAAPDQVDVPNSSLVYNQLKDSVESHLMADVDVGIFLSGGLDSSIVGVLAREGFPTLQSFAVGMEDSVDLQYARYVAKFLGTNHHEYVYTQPEMMEVLRTVIYHLESFDPALVRSAIPNYFLAKLASEHVKVVLSGEGADELFSGYAYLKQFQNPTLLHQELTQITTELHNRNLQRLDRITMAYGLEGRVPFLDGAFLELAFRVPVEYKLYGKDRIEKWILRKAFENHLPINVVWRSKEKFSKGAGSAHIFEQIADYEISTLQFVLEQQAIFEETTHLIRSKEELYYYRIFREFFKASITQLVGFSRSL